MTEKPSEELLYRFVDGECSPSEELEILQAEQDDLGIAQQVREIRKQNAVLRAALDMEMQTDIPETIVQAASSADGVGFVPFRNAGFGRPGAALLVACLIGVIAVGTGWSHWRINQWQEAVVSLTAQREAALTDAIQQVLESNLSGDALAVNDPSLDFAAVVQPEETYRSTSGHWCRRFTERVRIGPRDIEREAIACRENGARNWTRMKTVIDGAAEGQLALSAFDALTN